LVLLVSAATSTDAWAFSSWEVSERFAKLKTLLSRAGALEAVTGVMHGASSSIAAIPYAG
jgi:hypothetical protein